MLKLYIDGYICAKMNTHALLKHFRFSKVIEANKFKKTTNFQPNITYLVNKKDVCYKG